jgi:site-specific DNA recombinase
MDVVIYTRVSTEDQKENGFSLQDQLIKLTKFCKEKGYIIVKHYEEDFSAKNFERPQFKKFLDDVKNKRIKPQKFICVRFDRFSRNASETINMINFLKKFKIEVCFLENQVNLDTPENLLQFYINAVLPQIENERRALNTKTGMRQALKQGRWMWNAPKGYINEKASKLLKINIEEAELIKYAFEQVSLNIKPIDSIRKELLLKGFKCSKSRFYNLLKDPIYIGYILIKEWNSEPEELVRGLHDAIISKELFQKVQKVLSQKTKKPFHKNSTKHEIFQLKGHLICKQCNKLLTASSSKGRSKKYNYYHCSAGCNERIAAEVLNDNFKIFLKSIEIDSKIADLYQQVLLSEVSKMEKTAINKEENINRNIKNLQIQLEKIDNQLINSQIDMDDYKRISNSLKSKIQQNENDLFEIRGSETNFEKQIKYGINLLSHLEYYFQKTDYEMRNAIIGSIFSDKLIYEKNSFRTVKENSFLSIMHFKSNSYKRHINKKAIISDGLSSVAPPSGLEPETP